MTSCGLALAFALSSGGCGPEAQPTDRPDTPRPATATPPPETGTAGATQAGGEPTSPAASPASTPTPASTPAPTPQPPAGFDDGRFDEARFGE